MRRSQTGREQHKRTARERLKGEPPSRATQERAPQELNPGEQPRRAPQEINPGEQPRRATQESNPGHRMGFCKKIRKIGCLHKSIIGVPPPAQILRAAILFYFDWRLGDWDCKKNKRKNVFSSPARPNLFGRRPPPKDPRAPPLNKNT